MVSTKHLSVYVPNEMAKAVKEHAAEHGIATSDVLRSALEHYFKSEGEADRIEWIANDIKGAIEQQVADGNKEVLSDMRKWHTALAEGIAEDFKSMRNVIVYFLANHANELAAKPIGFGLTRDDIQRKIPANIRGENHPLDA